MKILIKCLMEDDTFEDMYQIHIPTNELAHEICMGIRHGLFGADSEKNESINNNDIADALYAIADALVDINNNEKK